MGTLFQLITHEYRKYVFTRGFLMFLLLMPLTLVFTTFASSISEKAAPVRHFMVLEETGEFTAVIDKAIEQSRMRRELNEWDAYAARAVRLNEDGSFPLSAPFTPDDTAANRLEAFRDAGGIEAAIERAKPFMRDDTTTPPDVRTRFIRLAVPQGVLSTDNARQVETLRNYIRGEESIPGSKASLFAAILIPTNVREGAEIQFYTNTILDGDLRRFVDRAITDALKTERYISEGVDIALVDRIEDISVPVVLIKASGEGSEKLTDAQRAETFIPLMLAYILFIMILSIGGMLLTSTVEEKSNKIVEVLLSSVSAGQLMAGKLIGLLLVGLTIPTLFLSAGFIATEILSSAAASGSSMSGAAPIIQGALFDSPLIPIFFFYFTIGYLLFASIYLAVGAMSNTIQDAQSFVGPLTILLMLPAPFLPMIVQDPNGLVARVLTWIPIYTPYAVMIRMSAEPPLWEIIGATILLLCVVTYVVMTMGRIYRNGVLSSGGAPSFKQVRALVKKAQ